MNMTIAHLPDGRPYLRGPIGPKTKADYNKCGKLLGVVGFSVDTRESHGGVVVAPRYLIELAARHAAAEQAGT